MADSKKLKTRKKRKEGKVMRRKKRMKEEEEGPLLKAGKEGRFSPLGCSSLAEGAGGRF